MSRIKSGIFFLWLLLPVIVQAAVIHVPADYPTIQAGINAASKGDTVLVADGTYTGTGNRDLDFYGKAITVRSERGPENCIMDCEDSGRGVFFHSGEEKDSVLQGFRIINGDMDSGGGIYCDRSSPAILDNILEGNEAFSGGGIFCNHASPMIVNNTITGNDAYYGGGVYCEENASPAIMKNMITENRANNAGGICCWPGASPHITNNTITGNEAMWYGGGILCYTASPVIANNIITGNRAEWYGGGICCWDDASPAIMNNTIAINTAVRFDGGGIYCFFASPAIINNRISENTAGRDGSGICCWYASPGISNNIITGNTTDNNGGGICCRSNSSPEIANNTISENTAQVSGGGISSEDASPTITNTILRADSPEEIYVVSGSLLVTYSNVEGGYAGEGNIDADPLFVGGPMGDFYLSQFDAGQSAESPCVNAGDPGSTMLQGTTRTDNVQDSRVIDMGCHYPLLARLVTGPGPGYDNPPHVRIFPPEQNGVHEYEFGAYGPPHFGVNVICGDVTGDNLDEIITGPGPGAVFGPHVRGFQPDSTPVAGLSFIAYGTRKFGVNVATGDLDGDGFDEIITGAGPGAVFGPHVRAFNYDDTSSVTPVPGVSFMAYGIRLWGVNVTAGDIDSDGFAEIVTGPGPGAVFGPHVRGWNVDDGPAGAINAVSFLAYGTRKYGCVVSCGDADGDGIDEIITAPGPAQMFASHIGGWNFDGMAVSPLPGYSFFAWPSSDVRYGGRVFAGADLDRDGTDELVVGAGPDPSVGSPVKVFRYEGFGLIELFSLQAFPSTWTHGVNVAAGQF